MRLIVSEQSPKAKQSPFKNLLDHPRLGSDRLLLCNSSSVGYTYKLSSAYSCRKSITYCVCSLIPTIFHWSEHFLTFFIHIQLCLYPPSILLPLQKISHPTLPSLYWKSPSSAPSRDCFPFALNRDQLEEEHAVHFLSSLFSQICLSSADPYFL